MWFFNSPQIIFGEQSLSYLERLEGERATVITDANLVRLGLVERVCAALPPDMQVLVFDRIEPDPCLETVRQGAQALQDFQPEWIIALGGGSVMDAAKGIWVLYEHPEIEPEAINPVEDLHMRTKARLVAIPTTTGTGSEATWAVILTDKAERRKLGLGNRELIPDLAILDPELVKGLPPRLSADTGLDALTHAIEGFTSTWHNDFSDGLCLKAAQMIFQYLPQVHHGEADLDAISHLQNAATIAGLGFGNAMAALAHGMGHALGGVFHIPHGRAVALCLPYTIEYAVRGEPGSTRYTELAHFLGLSAGTEQQAAESLAEAVRELERQVGQPLSLEECGLTRAQLEADLDLLVQNALSDTQSIMHTRVPEWEDLERLFLACFHGSQVDF